MEKLWQRVSLAKHTALVGIPVPAVRTGVMGVRVNCNRTKTPLGPIIQARHQVEQLLESQLPLIDLAADRVRTGLRRRLLGEGLEEPERGAGLVEALNRLQRESGQSCVLVFEAMEGADEATLEVLRQVISRPGWLKVPLVLEFRVSELSPAAKNLVAKLQEVEGEEAILRAEAPAPRIDPTPLPTLKGKVLRVLRAGALAGEVFEAELIALLLGLNAATVLELLQSAVDSGVALTDLGEGRFQLREETSHHLRAGLLPSLEAHWHRRLAELLSRDALTPEAIAPEDTTPEAVSQAVEIPEAALPEVPKTASESSSLTGEGAPAESVGADDTSTASRPTPVEPSAAAVEMVSEGGPAPEPEKPGIAAVVSELPVESEPARSALEQAAAEAVNEYPFQAVEGAESELAAPEMPSEPTLAPPPPPPSAPTPPRPPSARAPFTPRPPVYRPGVRLEAEPRQEHARAARHLAAVGERDAAAQRLLAAVQQASRIGAHPQAIAYARQALGLLETLPSSPSRRQLKISLLGELGRLYWESAGPTADFTLRGALAWLEQALALLKPEDPAALGASIKTLIAGVCYDLGDRASLDRALDVLTEAIRALQSEGDAGGAARLLNDQAAVWVRLGDPVRAYHLLSESKKLHEDRADRDPEALAELAETNHLLARLTFHVPPRPGREADSLQVGIQHAEAAEALYRRLRATREVGRVKETLGRLEHRANHADRAMGHLQQGIEIQQRLGDVLGLARTADALVEVLTGEKRFKEALSLLSQSIELNREKGSPLGLAYNRQSLKGILKAAPGLTKSPWGEAIRRLSGQLQAAESMLGKVELPGEG